MTYDFFERTKPPLTAFGTLTLNFYLIAEGPGDYATIARLRPLQYRGDSE